MIAPDRPMKSCGAGVAAAAIAVLFLPGCAWVLDRSRDATQIVSFDAGYGYGLSADVTATDLFQFGFGAGRAWKAGVWEGRAGRWQEGTLHFPGGFFLGATDPGPLYTYDRLNYWPFYQRVRLPAGAELGRGPEVQVAESSMLSPLVLGRSNDRSRWTDRLRFDVGVQAGSPALRFRFDLGELVDLVAGLAGLDPAGDDLGDVPEPEGEWLAGDGHAHFSPPDSPGHAPVTLEETLEMARDRGLDFVFLTPHLWSPSRGERAEIFASLERVQALRGDPDLLVVPGFETTLGTPGHVGVVFVDPAAIAEADEPTIAALEAGALGFVEHPFSIPIPFPRIRILHVNLGWDPWLPDVLDPARLAILSDIDHVPFADRARADAEVWGESQAMSFRRRYTGAEVYNSLRHLLETLLVPDPAEWTVHRTFARLARDALAQGRRLVGIGGSDNHHDFLVATTWVRVEARTEAALADGLRRGRVVVGRPDARTFRARSDLAPQWRSIGDDLAADRRVELAWHGRAALYVDDALHGEFAGGTAIEIEPGSRHVLRIVLNGSYSNFIYVNFGLAP